jgi:hypothetical protein
MPARFTVTHGRKASAVFPLAFSAQSVCLSPVRSLRTSGLQKVVPRLSERANRTPVPPPGRASIQTA